MNRRTFLGHTALWAGGTALMGLEPAAPRPIRCVLMGINHSHGLDLLGVLRKSKDYEVVGIHEPDAAVRKQFEGAKDVQGLPWLSEKEALEDQSIQMAAIESDVPRLLDLAQAAVKAGKHIHLDKPAGASLPQFKAILDDAERQQRIVQMGYMFRYNPGFDFIRQTVREGKLGEVYAIHASMCTQLTDDKRKSKAFHPGGIMLELGSHLIDMIVLLLGAPTKVSSFLRHAGTQNDGLNDNTMAVLEYDKALATVETAAMEPDAFPRRRFKVAGTKGVIVLEPLEPPKISFYEDSANPARTNPKSTWNDVERHVLDVADLAKCIRGEATFAYSKEHDYLVQQTLLRACGENV